MPPLNHLRRFVSTYSDAPPKTPYQRLLDSPDVPGAAKAALRKTYNSLDAVKLHREILRLDKMLVASTLR
jgi:hypothetical protein